MAEADQELPVLQAVGLWQVVAPPPGRYQEWAVALREADQSLAELGRRWAEHLAGECRAAADLGAALAALGRADQFRCPGGRPDPGPHP